MPGQNTIAKTRRESLNLRFDLIRHIPAAVEWSMAVRPKRVLATRGARFIEQTLLRNQHKRAFGDVPAHNLPFGRSDFVNAATEMNCSCATTSFGFPRNGFVERVIDFENSRRVPERFQPTAISGRQFFTGDTQKFPNGN